MHGSSVVIGSDDPRSPSTGTSRSLIERVRADETAAWYRLVSLYAPMVLHWCRRRDLQEQDAADIFQEVFQAVATHITTFRKENDADTFRGWLRRITENKVHDYFRRRGREPAGVGGTEANARMHELTAPISNESDAEADNRTERELFHRALSFIRSEFEDRTWQAFWRTAVDGLPSNEVAVELAMTSGAVRVAKCRVLQRLREELGDLV